MTGFGVDFRYALRRLGRTPGFVALTVATLMLGIGLSTAIYSGVRSLLWMPLGVDRDAQLFPIHSGSILVVPGVSWPDFLDLEREQSGFAHLSASRPLVVPLVVDSVVRSVFGEAVSRDYFRMLGVHPIRGRLLQDSDDERSERNVVVSEAFWKFQLGSAPDVIGRPLRVGASVFHVVGVVRFAGFQPMAPTAVWLSLSAATQEAVLQTRREDLLDRATPSVLVWGRLRSGIGREQAHGQVSAISHRFDEQYPLPGRQKRDWSIVRNAQELVNDQRLRGLVGVLLAIALTVAVIASFNAANLALARSTSQARDNAVLAALGASRWRLIRVHLFESIILTGVGGLVAWAGLHFSFRWLSIDAPLTRDVVFTFRPEVNASALLAGLGFVLVSLTIAGLWPAIASNQDNVGDRLRTGASSTPRHWRAHHTIVAWQVCGAVALFLVSAACVKIVKTKFQAQQRPAFSNVSIATIDFRANGLDAQVGAELAEHIEAGLRTEPGIASGSLSTGLPLPGMARLSSVSTKGGVQRSERASVIVATPGLFATLGIRLLVGRTFRQSDSVDSDTGPSVAIVSDRLGRRLFADGTVLGKTVVVGGTASAGGTTCTVVGVTAEDVPATAPASLFLALQRGRESKLYVTASAKDARLALTGLRSVLRRESPELAIGFSGTASDFLDRQSYILRKMAEVSGVLGFVGLLLAMVGLYAVLSHVVASRSREIGVRMAVGASRAQVFTLVMREGLSPVAKGILLGMLIGACAPLLARTLVVVDAAPFDYVGLFLVPILFLPTALVAVYLPAAHASRVDPMSVLRDS